MRLTRARSYARRTRTLRLRLYLPAQDAGMDAASIRRVVARSESYAYGLRRILSSLGILLRFGS